MTNTLKLLIVAILFQLTGCYSGISGKVVDGVTGIPLEGAVVLAQWTKTHGFPGLTSHTVYKIEETETDKEGIFSIAGAYSPFVEPPQMVIYKKGYVPWRNDMTFEKMETYDKVIWQNDLTYKLERCKEGYSKERLNSFLGIGIDVSSKVPIFQKIEIESSEEARKEMKVKYKVIPLR